MVLQIWIIGCLKMCKISGTKFKVITFIENTMENWRMELTERGKSLPEVIIQREIFQGDTISPLSFVFAKMPLSHLLRKCTEEYKLDKSPEIFNHLIIVPGRHETV